MFHRTWQTSRTPTLVVLAWLLIMMPVMGQSDLAKSFQYPPQSAQPWVYWFWMNGNITRTGITADLEAMHELGIGGCLIMHVKLGDIGGHKLSNMPPDGPVTFMSDQFRELFRYAVAEADRLGMKIDMNNADGFTGSGGPWVPVGKSMKKLVWTETSVAGGKKVSARLPQPETVLDFYHDVAVIAFPRQSSLVEQMKEAESTFSAPHETFNSLAVADGDRQTRTPLWQRGNKGEPHLMISFADPYSADTLVIQAAGIARGTPKATLEISDDGTTFRPIGSICLKWYPAAPTNTVRFDALKARHFRLRFAPNCQHVSVGDVALGRSNKIHYWEPKAGFTRYGEWGGGSQLYTDRKLAVSAPLAAKSSPSSASPVPAIRSAEVIDLSDGTGQDGRLSWNAPEGDWTILRIGYTTTGIKNHPASKGGHGLECDKLHPSGVEAAFDGMLNRLIVDCPDRVGRSFTHAHVDSWEVGIQNWTEGMSETFERLNGYDLSPFYPLLVAGHAVQANEVSERFLWDLRCTLQTMMAENYLGRIRTLCHENGLQFSSEAGGRQTFLHNPVELLARSDLPMGEFWPHEGSSRVDGKAAASVAHLYNRQIAGAESFTGGGTFANWQSHPYRLKQIGDEAFCLGINHFIIHYCVHQAYEGFRPGFVMGPWGIHLDRMNTWWEQGKPWIDYLARCQHLLRQGQFVADVLYFPGEGAPHYFGKRQSLSAALPPGYDYDGCDRETLLHRLSVKDGCLVLPSGMSYRYLMLADQRTMTPELARRVRDLVEAGATVIGPKPVCSPSFHNFPQCDDVVREIASALWDNGRVIWGKTFEQIAQADKLPPDFAFTSPSAAADIRYIHRRVGNMDLYFVANRSEEVTEIVANFRISGRRPELWDPETGKISLPAVFDEVDGRIQLPMHLDRLQSMFVLFCSPGSERRIVEVVAQPIEETSNDLASKYNGPMIVLTQDEGETIHAQVYTAGTFQLSYSDGSHRTVQVTDIPERLNISGPWQLYFPSGWDAPEQIELDKLISWTDHTDFNIRHFSGTANYRTTFEHILASQARNQKWILDLGDVREIAQVVLNGQDLGTLWKPPYRVEVTQALKPGQNHLDIRITNLWPNRLIGDEHFPDDAQWEGIYLKSWPDWLLDGRPRPEPRRKTFAVVKHYDKNSPLLPSGLLGPVTLIGAKKIEH